MKPGAIPAQIDVSVAFVLNEAVSSDDWSRVRISIARGGGRRG